MPCSMDRQAMSEDLEGNNTPCAHTFPHFWPGYASAATCGGMGMQVEQHNGGNMAAGGGNAASMACGHGGGVAGVGSGDGCPCAACCGSLGGSSCCGSPTAGTCDAAAAACACGGAAAAVAGGGGGGGRGCGTVGCRCCVAAVEELAAAAGGHSGYATDCDGGAAAALHRARREAARMSDSGSAVSTCMPLSCLAPAHRPALMPSLGACVHPEPWGANPNPNPGSGSPGTLTSHGPFMSHASNPSAMAQGSMGCGSASGQMPHTSHTFPHGSWSFAPPAPPPPASMNGHTFGDMWGHPAGITHAAIPGAPDLLPPAPPLATYSSLPTPPPPLPLPSRTYGAAAGGGGNGGSGGWGYCSAPATPCARAGAHADASRATYASLSGPLPQVRVKHEDGLASPTGAPPPPPPGPSTGAPAAAGGISNGPFLSALPPAPASGPCLPPPDPLDLFSACSGGFDDGTGYGAVGFGPHSTLPELLLGGSCGAGGGCHCRDRCMGELSHDSYSLGPPPPPLGLMPPVPPQAASHNPWGAEGGAVQRRADAKAGAGTTHGSGGFHSQVSDAGKSPGAGLLGTSCGLVALDGCESSLH